MNSAFRNRDLRVWSIKAALAMAVVLAGCSVPYASRPGLTVLEDVHVRSLQAVKNGVWFVNATGTNAALTVGFISNDGRVQKTFFTLRDLSLLPSEPPGAGITIQPLSKNTACITLSATYPEPHEVAIATVHLDGRRPSLAVEKGVEEIGTITLVRGRVFAGESKPALMELRAGKIVDHWLPKSTEAPKSTLIAVTDHRGRVVVGDGSSGRVGVFSVRGGRGGTWTFTHLAGVSNFSDLALADDGSAWALSEGGRLLTKTDIGASSHRTFDLSPNAGQGITLLPGGVACTGSSNGEQVVTCISSLGEVSRTKVALAYPPTLVTSNRDLLWYAQTNLRAPPWSFGNPDWGSAVGQIALH